MYHDRLAALITMPVYAAYRDGGIFSEIRDRPSLYIGRVVAVTRDET
jgi:hypothetical protein